MIAGDMLSGALSALGVVLVLTFLMGAGRRASATVDAPSGARVVRYPFGSRFLAWVLFVITVGASAFALTQMSSHLRIVVCALICSSVIAALAALLLEFTRLRASWTRKQVELDSPWTGKRALDWSDLAEVRFSQSMNWFVLRARTGTVIRLSGLLGGLTELLSELREQAAPALVPQVEQAVSEWRRRTR